MHRPPHIGLDACLQLFRRGLPGVNTLQAGLEQLDQLLNSLRMLRAMLEERRPLYQGVARVTVRTDDLSPEEIAGQMAGSAG